MVSAVHARRVQGLLHLRQLVRLDDRRHQAQHLRAAHCAWACPFRRHQPFEQVAARPHRADGQRERREPATEPEHVHVEGVAAGRARRPPAAGQRVAGHDGAVALQQGGRETGLDRWQGHPPVAQAEHAVVVEGGRGVDPGLRSRRSPSTRARRSTSPAGTRIQSSRSSGAGRRRRDAVLEEQQPGLGPRAAARRVGPARRASARGRHPRRRRYGAKVSRLFRPCEAFTVDARRARHNGPRGRLCCAAMARQSHLDHLASVSLFSACSKKELQAVARASDEVELPAGRTLCEQGTHRPRGLRHHRRAPPRSGATTRRSPRSGPGTCVGELALLDHGPRTATVDRRDRPQGPRDRRPGVRRDRRRGPVDRPQAAEGAGRHGSATSTPRSTADRSGSCSDRGTELRSRREVPRQAPPAGDRARRPVRHASPLVSGVTATIAQWHDDSDVQREVFGNIPSVWKLVFYTVLPVLILYGSVLFSQRVRNWERGAPDNRPTTTEERRAGASRTSGPASTCRPCCAIPPPGSCTASSTSRS